MSSPAQRTSVLVSVLGHISMSPFAATMPVQCQMQPTCDLGPAGSIRETNTTFPLLPRASAGATLLLKTDMATRWV